MNDLATSHSICAETVPIGHFIYAKPRPSRSEAVR